MIFIKKINKLKKINKIIFSKFIILLSIFSPYICEEIWNLMGNKKSIFFEKQPCLNKKYINKKIKYIIMLNNKKKFILNVEKINNNKNYLLKKVKKLCLFKKKIKIKKIIFIKNKILNYLF
ncbi:MAG: class I tRNA ligase family protein [Candidatus Shikimatogenerans bostrichidophilus]|nr:MAG: class I tRNA ligase family protein [Candidatus Shikimatogenerans bostrichidophilus]